jgi:hypothetical protein
MHRGTHDAASPAWVTTSAQAPKHSVRLRDAAGLRHSSSECRRYPAAGARRSTPVHVHGFCQRLRSVVEKHSALHLCSRRDELELDSGGIYSQQQTPAQLCSVCPFLPPTIWQHKEHLCSYPNPEFHL